MKAGRSKWGQLLRILCALALVLAAFAHRPAQPTFANEFDLASYTLPDGTVPVVCQTGFGGDPADKSGTSHCEFCRIASAIALPQPTSDFAPCAIELALEFHIPRKMAPPRQGFFGTAPARGPPTDNHNS